MTLPFVADITNQQLAQIRETLERTLRRMERNGLLNGHARPREIDQSTVGRLSRIEALQNQGFTESLEARERTQRDEVVQALRRIDDGVFGLCSGCRAPIGFERLLVFPETRTCTGCWDSV